METKESTRDSSASDRSISGVSEVVSALCWGEGFEDVADAAPDALDGSLVGLAQQGLDFGEHLLDWVEIG